MNLVGGKLKHYFYLMKLSKNMEHMERMHEVTKLKLAKAWSNKSPYFTLEELEKGLSDLNKGKARDPQGLCAELFQKKT